MLHRIAIAVVATLALTASALPVPDTITYQGRLEDSKGTFDGNADIRVDLYDRNTIIDTATFNTVAVTEGLFALELDFDVRFYDGRDLDLEFHVRAPAGIGAFQTLSPRQPLTTTPYAFQANTADTALASETLTPPAVINAANLTEPTVFINNTTPAEGPPALFINYGNDIIIDHPNAALAVESSRNPAAATFIGRQVSVVASLNDFSNNGGVGMVSQVISTNPQKADSQTAFRAFHTSNNTQADLGTAVYAAELTGDATINGEFSRRFSTLATERDLLHPVAYGFINFDGSVLSGTPNFSCVFNTTLERYEIEIDNENYFFSEYVTVVTPASTGIIAPSVASQSGRLIVQFATNAGLGFQAGFQFVTYRTSAGENARAVPRKPIAPLPAGIGLDR